MKFRIIVVGKYRNDPLVEAADDYLKRIGRYVSVELVEVKETPRVRSVPDAKVKAEEAQRIRLALQPSERVIALDERGRTLTTLDVSGRLNRWMESAVRSVAFVVGGPSGLDPELLQRADERWSLSPLTLPHRLARVLLLEQIYRGLTILRGAPYHK